MEFLQRLEDAGVKAECVKEHDGAALTAADALDLAAEMQPLPCTEQSDGTWQYAGDAESGSYTVTFSDSGEPLCVEMPAQPFVLRFSGLTVLVPDTASSTTATEASTSAETTVTT